jgi:hypothetical protein
VGFEVRSVELVLVPCLALARPGFLSVKECPFLSSFLPGLFFFEENTFGSGARAAPSVGEKEGFAVSFFVGRNLLRTSWKANAAFCRDSKTPIYLDFPA